MVDRHAYLIMCHTNYDQLGLLLDLLDDERNDIYLHIDKKAKNYSIDDIKTHSLYSNLYFIKPMRINWGGDSQIKLELTLLAEATKTPHTYYHLLSGMDLPLKTQDEIHTFFNQHSGCDYVSLERDHPHNITKSYMDRLNYYYFFQNYIKRGSCRFLLKLQNESLRIQKRLRLSRTRKTTIDFQKGANWFSITHPTACYVLNEYSRYRKHFRFTYCADEIFLQTILINSSQAISIIDDNLRFIDWTRGKPYIFRSDDYDLLIESNKLFARKFDVSVDATIIHRIYDSLMMK